MIGFWIQELCFIPVHTEKSYRIMLQVILVRCILLIVQPWMLWVYETSVWLLEKVRHIPDLRRNLIFVGQLDDEGMQYYLLVVLGRLQRGPEYWLVERRLVLYI